MPRIEFDNPFGAPGKWWRGNLHTHTTVSDGELTPAETAARYRALGYDFLAITDHLVVSKPFDAPDGLLLVPGAEYHTVAGAPPRCWHFVSIGTKRPVTGAMGPVDELREQVRENSVYWFLAHPNWSNLAEDDLLDVGDCPAVEVYNGVCDRAIARGYSQSAWDRALAGPRRMNALAVDDAHAAGDVGRGWIVLRACPASRPDGTRLSSRGDSGSPREDPGGKRSRGTPRLTLDAVYEALARGHWYSTTGPEIHDVRVHGSVVSVRTSPARSIAFVARSPDGKRFAPSAALGAGAREGSFIEHGEYEIKGTEIYLRIEVEDAAGRRAFTNPMAVRGDGKRFEGKWGQSQTAGQSPFSHRGDRS